MPLLLDWTTDADRRHAAGRGRHFAHRPPACTVAGPETSRVHGSPLPRPVAFDHRPYGHRPVLHHAAPAQARPGLGRAYNLILGAGTVSSLGDGVAFVAFPLLATSLTHSAALIAGVAMASRLPWLVVALPAGALADRFDRRRMLTTIEASRMAVLLALGLSIATHRVDLLQLYLAAFLLGSFETGFVATTQAVLPEVIPGDQLAKGNGRLFAAQMAGEQFAGPAVGGLLFAAAAALPFVADGLSFAASAALLALALPRRPRRRVAAPVTVARRSIRSEVAEGVTWLTRQPVLRLVAVMIATFAFCQSMGLAILVVYGLRVLHLSGSAFGLFVAGGAIGNLIGALGAHRVLARVGIGRLLVGAGVLAGTAFLLVAGTSSVAVALGAFILEAVAVGLGNVASLSLRQSMIPRELAGRVNAALRMCISGAAAIGALAGGALATVSGAQAPFLAGGVLQLLAGLAIGVPLSRALADQRDADDLVVEDWVSAPPSPADDRPAVTDVA